MKKHKSKHHFTIIFITSLLIVFSAINVSSEEQGMASIIAKIDAINVDIERLSDIVDDDPNDLLPMLKKRLRAEQKIGDQLNLGLKRLVSEPGEASTSALVARVENQFQRLTKQIAETQERMTAIRLLRSAAEPDALIEYEYDLSGYDDLFSKLLQELVDNASRAESLAMESAEVGELLENTLTDRAERQADRLEITHDRVKATAGRLATAPEGRRVTIEKELVALEERQQRIAKGMDSTIDMLRMRNLNADQYTSILVAVTGELSGDVLDSKILFGIMEDWVQVTRDSLVKNGPRWLFKAVIFLLILIIAKVLSKITGSLVGRAVRASPMSFSTLLQQFFIKLAANTVLGIGLLIALAQIGIHLGPVLAGLGVAGLIVGFALQDTLSNFASGLMILIYRPYDVGDVIEAGGVSGKVQRMNLVSTTIQTFDNQKLLVPNNKIWGDVIRNVNAAPTRRVDLVFGIGYEDDISAAEKILMDIVAEQELVLKDPEPVIKLHKLGESSVDFIVRPWVNAEDYWAVHWNITRAVKEKFTASGISIPYPQRDVHLYQHSMD